MQEVIKRHACWKKKAFNNSIQGNRMAATYLKRTENHAGRRLSAYCIEDATATKSGVEAER